MTMRRGWACFLMASALGCAAPAHATDYLYELGVAGGMSWAYGDLNKTKPIYNPSFAGAVQFRYNPNLRWSILGEVGSFGLQGDSRDFGNVYPDGHIYTVDSRVWQLTVRPEFAFRNYGWGNDFREKQRLVPFITAGLGVGFASGTDRTAVALCIPLGAGMKWKIAPRWNVQATLLFTKTFTDGIDGVEDPMGIPTDALKCTDWYGALTVGISYDFKERCETCNGEKRK